MFKKYIFRNPDQNYEQCYYIEFLGKLLRK